ncbi:MAG: hypothetical protein AVDCRST_MAG74-296 [uncultured Pyrinomonadaceae bacterium]|uniref:Uncharacterized protein n=1 Tax=uncultured Pyrinomonadaceae bacterium TaxID=2283094 RepID=A0A6J4NBH0_9BACT|nr:MAG: hypothetical protein AVDCRST_MAG74-296 [uncultured Pyrinomonadaceae bacterium]
MDDKLEKLSAGVNLTVLEIDYYPDELIPAFLLSKLMSPALGLGGLRKRLASMREFFTARKTA